MRWLWIDRIVELRPGQRLLAVKSVSLSEPHLHMHFPPTADQRALPVAPAPLIIEGMAQAGGILAGHARGFRDEVVLAKVRSVTLHREALPGTLLEFEALLQSLDDAGASVQGTVRLRDPRWAEPVHLGDVDLLFAHVPAAQDGLRVAEAFEALISASVLAGGPGVHGLASAAGTGPPGEA